MGSPKRKTLHQVMESHELLLKNIYEKIFMVSEIKPYHVYIKPKIEDSIRIIS
jgi:hypothetical protein